MSPSPSISSPNNEEKPRRSAAILLTVAYDGAGFNGIAPQGHGIKTVSAALVRAIAQMDPHAGRLRITSRTDAGVHARGQIVCFDTDTKIGNRGWVLGLSSHLPPEVSVVRAARVAAGFNPSKQAVGKTYRYTVLRGTRRDPFLHSRSWRVHDALNVELMQREARDLLGTHDFAAFRGAADIRKNTVRTIERVGLRECTEIPRCLIFEIRGDRFLYNMVRIIVGTLVDVGRGRAEPGAVRRGLSDGNRLQLGMTAPADGLCLERVELANEGQDPWPTHW